MRRQIQRLNQWFKNLKFRYKLTILMLVAGLVPVGFLAFSMQYGMMNQLRETEQDNLDKLLEQSVNSMENQAQIYENLVDYLSYSQDLRDILDMKTESDYETYLKYVKVADPLLQMPTIYHKEIKQITLYSDNIEVAHGENLLPIEEAEKKQWYSRLDEDTLMQWNITRGANKSIIASRKFYDNDKIKAVLEMQLDYESVLDPFIGQLTDNTGGIIQDDNGNIVYAGCSMDEKYQPENIENLKEISKDFYCVKRTMKDTGWKFYIYRPKAVSEEAIMKLLLKNIPLVLISILLLVLLGHLFSIRIVSQLERLTENMNQINMGLRKVTVRSRSNDEVGVLIRSFQRMMDQMNHLISEVYESKIQLQNSEMKALQAQINPHFLYNSLSIINWKAIEAGEDDISRVTLALSTYYRTSLNRGETMTTVAKEIDNIRAYLKIQLVMHDNEFRVIEQISDGIGDYVTPKLILQPLAENAIDHGIDVSEKEEPCLWLTVREEKEHIFFEIRDNGAGMTQEKADQILTYQSSGYGVRNVYDRIRVLYGEKGEMKVESTLGEGTRVFIRIPKRTEAKVL